MSLALEIAKPRDYQKLHEMQTLAFAQLLERYQDYDASPATQSLEDFLKRLENPNRLLYKILVDNELVGGIILGILPNEAYALIRIYLLPEHRGKGYAKQAIRALEDLYPQASRWILDTIREEAPLVGLYSSLGYVPTGREEPVKEGMTLIYFEKTLKNNT